MSRDDDFPPTQAAPPPPPEPPPAPQPARAARAPRQPSAQVYESVEQLLPAHTWKENPLVWIALVVAMFLAVPLLASFATRDKAVTPPKARAQAAASTPADAEPAQAVLAPPATAPVPVNANTAPMPSVNQLPPNLRPQSDASRQMITKCYENGRVVYTQTGACTGSMTAVPIDTGKNVVGPGGTAPTAPGAAPSR